MQKAKIENLWFRGAGEFAAVPGGEFGGKPACDGFYPEKSIALSGGPIRLTGVFRPG